MNNVVNTVYIIHRDGVPLLSVSLDETPEEQIDSFTTLFGGVSSAINTLIKELGHRELQSITVGGGLIVYSSEDPLLFVVHTTNPKHDQFARVLVKQVEYQFLKRYESVLEEEEFYVEGRRFASFENEVNELFEHLLKVYDDYPQLLEFMPSFIPLHQLYMTLNLGLDIIKGFPDDTIKLVRQLENYFLQQEEEALVAKTLGRYAGHIISQERFEEEFVIDTKDVLNLLNEISVTKFDKKDEVFDIVLCPICRGKTSERPICHFFSGFIEGALDNPSIHVTQTKCKAMGHKTCEFRLERD